MANSTHWVYANEAAAREVQAGFNRAAGLPRKGRQGGPGRGSRKPIPNRHSRGAYGWSEELVDVDQRTTAGPNGWAVQRAAECAPHEGKVVDVGGRDVTLPTEAEAVVREGDWEPRGAVRVIARP